MDRDVVRSARTRMGAVAALAMCLALVLLAVGSGAGGAAGSRALSALRHPSTAPLPLPFPMPADKAAHFRAMDRLRQRAAEIPATPPTNSSNQAALTAGILGLHDGGPFGPAQFIGTNLWNGPVHGRWLVVQAGGVPLLAPGSMPPGAAGAAHTRAGVFVYWRSSAPDSATPPRVVGVIRAPGHPTGELVVQRVHASVLVLSLRGSSRRYRFSIVSLRFL